MADVFVDVLSWCFMSKEVDEKIKPAWAEVAKRWDKTTRG